MNIIPKPKNSDSISDNFIAFVELVKILRKECPWDKEQTNESIGHLMIEEVYETYDAIMTQNHNETSKELGDLLLHIVMHSVIAEEDNKFSLIDIIQKIHHKMVSRHPHVFGETEVSGSAEVMNNWEKLKKKEGKKTVLEGVPNSLPSLLKAERIQQKAARVGFDWENKEDVLPKLEEELNEFKAEITNPNGIDKDKMTEEFGDLMFTMVNLARKYDIVPEDALQSANRKFTNRFNKVEQKVKNLGKNISDFTPQELDIFWEKAKKEE